LGKAPRTITADALARLRAHHWPGNVRELENLMERLLVLGDEGPIGDEELAELLPHAPSMVAPVQPASSKDDVLSLWELERGLLVQALERASHNQTQAARLLKISREQLRTRMKRYGLLPRRR
jgi:two-component system response regulator AtoC